MMLSRSLLAVVAATGTVTLRPADAAPANVLLISIDDLNSAVGCFGDPLARTPHMDALASRGTVFRRAYCQYPLCNPSRASMLTGLRPDNTQVYDLPTHFRDRIPGVVTLPQHFRNHGFWTARVGKIFHQGVPRHVGTDGPDDPFSWDVRVNPRGRDMDELALCTNLTPDRGPGVAVRYLAAGGADEEQTDGLIASETIRLLREAKAAGKPFFVAAGFYRPHVPFVAPKKYFEQHAREKFSVPPDPTCDLQQVPAAALWTRPPFFGMPRERTVEAIQAYYACVSFVDAQVGRLMSAVDELGLRESTWVVLWSDHGYMLGEHGQWAKESFYEPSLRAPLLIVPPGAGRAQNSIRVVEFVDIYPTLVDGAGLPRPARLDGRSLLPLLEDAGREWPHPAFAQLHTHIGAGRAIRTERWAYNEWGEAGADGTQLYDLQQDPEERVNLSGRAEVADTERLLREQVRAQLCVPPAPGKPKE